RLAQPGSLVDAIVTEARSSLRGERRVEIGDGADVIGRIQFVIAARGQHPNEVYTRRLRGEGAIANLKPSGGDAGCAHARLCVVSPRGAAGECYRCQYGGYNNRLFHGRKPPSRLPVFRAWRQAS